ncbi:Panacea domain-containing protein [Burkholderia pseudomallei]|uniref:Panacea domain-containing protein n=1 Tax=Burkholderia pseudomallei TaxID=28450 RepID=UPI00048C29DF|nr:Panacea domain-containing protein [Burkholderia pseudomallei]AJX94693.1 hypothetical protein BG24_1218 [Burkholderia pseudomallei PB08298010]MCW0080487.1 Panacea domain-containing protein [Burkholderia pseudomallei]OMR20471.1 hypothetical protein AQ721_19000 [Burkholderia pseudomallei]OMZ82854.1 hypothetical protein AQ870_00400 [Burkholderia pseudomallei]CAJ2989098.1 Uncharacterized phage-associated protein [Burkholderia pseudomallei]
MFSHLFNPRKAADSAAYLLFRAEAPMSSVKLMRLLYLAERESFVRFGEPLTGDELFADKKGPILRETHRRLNGDAGGWEGQFRRLGSHSIALETPAPSKEYFARSTVLSDADIEVLDAVWEQFGKLDQTHLADYLHTKCLEWTDSRGEASEVTHERLFKALGYSREQIEELLQRLAELDNINEVLSLSIA